MNNKLAYTVLVLSVVLLAINIYIGISSGEFNTFSILSNICLIIVSVIIIYSNANRKN